MKIAYCLQGTYISGGIERIVTGKANYFAAKGDELYIITTDQKGRPPFFELHPNIRCFDLGLNYTDDNQYSKYKRVWLAKKKQKLHKKLLSELLYKIKPDIVISTFFHEAPILPQIHDGSKKVLEMHTSRYARVLMYPPNRYPSRLYGRFRIYQDEKIARKFDRFVILTNEEKKRWNLSNVTVVPNYISKISNKTANLKSKKVIAVGRYEYVKNYSHLIDCWAKIHPTHPDWILEIIGDGYLRQSLQNQLNRLGLSESILLTPTTKDIVSHYLSASICVLTSHYEGLPMVLLEAQTVGLPIVAYACPSGPRDIITYGKDGFLIENGSQDKFIEKLKLLISDLSLREKMGNAAIVASGRYSEASIMKKWETLFNKLVGNE